MFRYIGIALIISILALVGCSSSGSPDITTPDVQEKTAAFNNTHQVWGYFQLIADPKAQTLEVVPLRDAAMHLNALIFLEPPPLLNLTLESLEFNGNIIEADIGLKHPFLGLTEFSGFDVCGILITNGSVTGYDDTNIRMAGEGDTRLLNPDGLSRWWNPDEFPVNDGTMFSYTDGLLGTLDSIGNYNSTLNAYKYFCDDFVNPDDPMDVVTIENRGLFSAGQKNIRHYTIELGDEGLAFNYAIDASWKFPNGNPPWKAPGDFPPDANRPEAWRVDVTEISNSLWNDGTSSGGALQLSLDVYDWYNIELNTVKVESPGNFPSVTLPAPLSGGEGYSTYQVEITDATPAQGAIDILISVECEDTGYGGLLPGKAVTAYFVHTTAVGSSPGNNAPVCELVINECTLQYWDITDHVAVEFDATGSYDPDDDLITFHWDFDDDDIYDEPIDDAYTGDPDNPSHDYYEDGAANVKVEDDKGGFSICSVNVDITERTSKNIPLREGWVARDLAVDPDNGELHILYYWHNTANNTHWIETYKYSPCELYTEPDEAFHTQPQGKRFHRIDVSGTHYSVIGGPLQGASGQVRNITPDGQDIGPNWIIGCTELWAFNDGGSYPYSHCTLYPFPNPPWNPNGYSSFLYRSPYTTTFDTWIQSALVYWDTQPVGPGYMYAGFVRGSEPVASGHQFWTLQDPGNPAIGAYYCNRWSLDASPGSLAGVNYNNAYFGTGSQTTSDSGWYNAQDLTRNSQDYLLVLDRLSSGVGRVKAFTGDASGGTTVGAFDVPASVNPNPLRIDSSDYEDPIYGNLMYILHGDSTSGYLLSIIFPDELPW